MEQLQKAYQINLHWRAFPLHPETPPEGRNLKELFANRPIDIDDMVDRLKQTAASLNLPFGSTRSMTYNSRLAQEVGLWAETQGRGEQFHMEAFRVYFVDGANLYRTDVLLDLAEKAGLPRDEALGVIENRSFKDDVDADWRLSRELGITAVPTFVMGPDRLVGAQPYEAMTAMMERQGVPTK